MTEALLATDAKQSTDATTTQGGTAQVDTQPAQTEQQKTETTTTDETEPTESKTEPTGEAKPEEKPEGAPELYEFDVPKGMPDGFEKDEAVFDSFATVARELDLPQEQAQKLIDAVLPTMQRRAEEQQVALHDTWVADTKADKDIGGRKLDENLATAKKAVETFGSPGLQELLNSPFGSHPEVVRFLVKVGQTVSEDKFVGGERRGESVDLDDPAYQAKVLYGKSTAAS